MLKHEKIKIVGLILLVAISLIVRLHDLDRESLFMDELRQVSYYPHSFLQIVNDAISQTQPPLDYWIGHIVNYFSASDFAVRLPAAIFGTLTVFLLTLILLKFTNVYVAFISGLLFSMTPFNLYYSQEARPYAIAGALFLMVLFFLERLIKSDKSLFVNSTIFLFWSTLFLYSRALAPLIIMASLESILFCLLLVSSVHKKPLLDVSNKNIIAAIMAICCAAIIYLPNFLKILNRNSQYLAKDHNALAVSLSNISNFDFYPVWQSYVVQSEPLTNIILFLLILSPCLILYEFKTGKKSPILLISLFLLPVAATMNLVVFQLKSGMPFRPPYAFYILPLIYILSAFAVEKIYRYAKKSRYKLFIYCFLGGFVVYCGYQSVNTFIIFKSQQIKPDWRGVTNYLEAAYGQNHAIIFDSLSRYGEWEPTFYGFPRYYTGMSDGIAMYQIPYKLKKVENWDDKTPVLVLFQWLEYRLTPSSTYPIIPGKDDFNYREFEAINELSVKQFKGFTVMELQNTSGNFSQDTFTLLTKILPKMPQDDRIVEILMAAAGLSKIMEKDDWKTYFLKIDAMVNQKQRKKIEFIREKLSQG